MAVERFFDRHGGKTIIVGRFIGFVRALAPFIAGASRLPYRRFLGPSIVGTGVVVRDLRHPRLHLRAGACTGRSRSRRRGTSASSRSSSSWPPCFAGYKLARNAELRARVRREVNKRLGRDFEDLDALR